MNKKGFILGEFTLKMVISIIVILLLVGLLYNIYDSFTKKSKLQKANATLERIKEGINIAYTQSQYNYVLTEPKSWVFIFYKNGEPLSCQGKRCFCICEKTSFFNRDQLNKCNSVGSCMVDNLVDKSDIKFEFDYIEIDEPTNIIIKNENGELIFKK